jgi:hypothetical protein
MDLLLHEMEEREEWNPLEQEVWMVILQEMAVVPRLDLGSHAIKLYNG